MSPEIAVPLLLAAAVGGFVTWAGLEARERYRKLRNRVRRFRRSIHPHLSLTDHSLEPRTRGGRGRRR